MDILETLPQPTPQHVAWLSLGDPSNPLSEFASHPCALCREPNKALYSVTDVISRNFTDWELFTPNVTGLCESCAWSFTEETAKVTPILIFSNKARKATRRDLTKYLSKPLPSNVALSLPVLHKKHILPRAQWGCVVSDKGAYSWGVDEATLFNSLLFLRNLGSNEGDLEKKAPPLNIVTKLNQEENVKLFDTWGSIVKYQKLPQWDIALRGSRKELL